MPPKGRILIRMESGDRACPRHGTRPETGLWESDEADVRLRRAPGGGEFALVDDLLAGVSQNDDNLQSCPLPRGDDVDVIQTLHASRCTRRIPLSNSGTSQEPGADVERCRYKTEVVRRRARATE